VISIERIAKAIKPRDIHFAPTRLLGARNTHGGRRAPLAYQRQATGVCPRARGCAPIWTAAAESSTPSEASDRRASRRAGFDSVSVASPRVWAPAGSGCWVPGDLIAQARTLFARHWAGHAPGRPCVASGRDSACEHHVRLLAQGSRRTQLSRDGLRALRAAREPPQTNICTPHSGQKRRPGSQEPFSDDRGHPRDRRDSHAFWSRIWMYRFLRSRRFCRRFATTALTSEPIRAGTPGLLLYTAFTSAIVNTAVFFHPRA